MALSGAGQRDPPGIAKLPRPEPVEGQPGSNLAHDGTSK